MNKWVVFVSLLLTGSYLNGQDLPFAKHQVKTLSSRRFHGRGYVKNGDLKASGYLEKQFKKATVEKFGSGYFQDYVFRVNTFPGNMSVKADRKKLKPGIDYIADPSSSGCKGTYPVICVDSSFVTSYFSTPSQKKNDFRDRFVWIDTLGFGAMHKKDKIEHLFKTITQQAGGIIVSTGGKLIFGTSTVQARTCILNVRRPSVRKIPASIKINLQSRLVTHHARNLAGYLPGRIDSFIVITAHYDHLGQMGRRTYFPGANDNASGTSLVLDLIKGCVSDSVHRKYSYAFILFSGEEPGLLGSQYYVAHPLFPLSKIKMLINFDMVGTGAGGVTVFCGSNEPVAFHRLDSLNRVNRINLVLRAKGCRPNSDQYPFYQKDVPALFFLTEDKSMPYHSIFDTYQRLPFTDYQNVYKLIFAYLKSF